MKYMMMIVCLLVVGCRGDDKASLATTPQNLNKDKSQPIGKNDVPKVAGEFAANAVLIDYKNNAVGAESKYGGKYWKLLGGFHSIKKTEDGRYCLGISVVSAAGLSPAQYAALTDIEKKWYNEGYPANVHCFIRPGEEGKFSNLKPGDNVAVVGTPKGVKKAEVWQGYLLEVDDCIAPNN